MHPHTKFVIPNSNNIRDMLRTRLFYLRSIKLLQNIANTLLNTTEVIKGLLFYCFSFEILLNSWLLSQKYGQGECTSSRRSSVASHDGR